MPSNPALKGLKAAKPKPATLQSPGTAEKGEHITEADMPVNLGDKTSAERDKYWDARATAIDDHFRKHQPQPGGTPGNAEKGQHITLADTSPHASTDDKLLDSYLHYKRHERDKKAADLNAADLRYRQAGYDGTSDRPTRKPVK